MVETPPNIRKVGPGARQPSSRVIDGGRILILPGPFTILCSEEAKTSAVDLFKTPTSRICTGIG